MQIHKSLDSLSGMKPVVTTGVFDGVHRGHQKLFSILRDYGKKYNAPTLVITYWPHPATLFRPDPDFRLVMSLEEKIMKISEFGIDHLLILPFDPELASMRARDFIKNIVVDLLDAPFMVVGDDHRFGRNQEGSFTLLKELGKQYGFGISDLITMTYQDQRISSTFIRTALKKGDLQTVNDLLGYYYFIFGEVEIGNRIGSTIGFPTANIRCCHGSKQIPGDGVYVVTVEWNNSFYGGMLNIGTRPTVDQSTRKSIEVHMFGHAGDLYSEQLKVSFVQRLRDEMKFHGIKELKQQLSIDKQKAIEVLTNAGLIRK